MHKREGFFLCILVLLSLVSNSPSLAQSDSVIATIQVGASALVYNSTDIKIYANKTGDSVAIIDGEGDSVIATVKVGATPYAFAYNPTNNKIYCANQYSDNVTIIDGATNNVITTKGVGDAPRALAYNPTNNKIYCANEGDSNVTVISGEYDWVMATVNLWKFAWGPRSPRVLGYNPTDNKIYCGVSHLNIFYVPHAGSVQIINPATDSVIASVLVNYNPTAFAYNPQDNKIYCANSYGVSKVVTIIDGQGDSAVATVGVGDAPSALAYNSANNKIYCANSGSNSVTIMDGEGDSMMAKVEVGDFPLALVYNPQNNKIYCANLGSDNVTVIDGASDTVITTLGVGDAPRALAYNSANNKIYCGGASISVIACSPASAVEEDQKTEVIPKFSLSQNYPNPFNPTTKIAFAVHSLQFAVTSPQSRAPSPTTLVIYNLIGQKVRTLVDEPKRPGSYEVVWDGKDGKGKDVASGMYFYQLKAGDFTETKKILLLK